MAQNTFDGVALNQCVSVPLKGSSRYCRKSGGSAWNPDLNYTNTHADQGQPSLFTFCKINFASCRLVKKCVVFQIHSFMLCQWSKISVHICQYMNTLNLNINFRQPSVPRYCTNTNVFHRQISKHCTSRTIFGLASCEHYTRDECGQDGNVKLQFKLL